MMNRRNIFLLALLSFPMAPGLFAQDIHLERAKRILFETPLIDGHNDLPWAIRTFDQAPGDVAAYDLRMGTPGHTDLARLKAGMLGGQFWSVYVSCSVAESGAARVQLEQIEIAKRIFARYPDRFEEARTASDIERSFGEGKIASLLGMEGGHAIERSLGTLRAFFDMGVRYMTLTHNCDPGWADPASDSVRPHGGLSEFGREVVREMNWLGMLVDLSHVAPETMHDALDVARAPVIFSHSSARALTDHVRNVPDDVLKRLPKNGGVVMVTFVSSFINEEVRTHDEDGPGPAPRATLADAADHIDHIRRVAGVDHVGIGGDFDGFESVPIGLEDVSTYPALFAELARRGWTDAELRKVAGENVLRAMRDAERISRLMRRERGPSMKTFEELDGK